MKRLICDYFEDALIFIDYNHKKFNDRPFLIVEMECDNTSDILFYEDLEWLYNSLDKDWADEILNWAKYHLNEIRYNWENNDSKMISERW